jgi:hypothetical protein
MNSINGINANNIITNISLCSLTGLCKIVKLESTDYIHDPCYSDGPTIWCGLCTQFKCKLIVYNIRPYPLLYCRDCVDMITEEKNVVREILFKKFILGKYMFFGDVRGISDVIIIILETFTNCVKKYINAKHLKNINFFGTTNVFYNI